MASINGHTNGLDGHNDDENTPLTLKVPRSSSVSTVFVLCSAFMITSIGMIYVKKWLMKDAHFPYALPLVLGFMLVDTIICLILYALRPSLFPTLTDKDSNIELDTNSHIVFLPIVVLWALRDVLFTVAFRYAGVAFLQMIKETNLIWVYIFSVLCGKVRFTMTNILVISMSTLAIPLIIDGEAHFQLIGFLTQVAGVICGAGHVVLQAVLLHSKKLDSFTYVLILSPSCFVLLVGVLLLSMAFGASDVILPPSSEVIRWAPWIVAVGILNFTSLLAGAELNKYTGPVSTTMCRMTRNVLVIVIVGAMCLHETVSLIQGLGYFVRSLMQLDRTELEFGTSTGLWASFFSISNAEGKVPAVGGVSCRV